MNRKGVLKPLAMLAMLALVICLLPVTADAATTSWKNDFKFSMDTGHCSTCDASSETVTNLTINKVTVEGRELTVSFTYTLDCPDDAAHSHNGEATYDAFDCAETFRDKAMECTEGSVSFSRPAGHAIGSMSSNGDGTHTGACVLCGKTKTEDCSGDSSANCSNPGTCSKCGGTYTREDDHAYSWKNDESRHWQECAYNPSHKINEGTCAVGSSGKAATCMEPAVCGTCGLHFGDESDTGHVWGPWTYEKGKTFHMRTCTLNENHKEGLLHGFDFAVAPGDPGHLHGTCKTCGYHMEAWLESTEESISYSGKAVTPLTIRYSDTWLEEKPADSAIVYKNNVDAGTATGTVTIAGKQLVGSFNIAPVTLNVSSVSAQSRAYDGTNKVTVTKVNFSGKISGDDVDFQTSKATIASSKVGTYNSVTCEAGDLVLKGNDKGNYRVSSNLQVPTDAPVVISVGTVKASIKVSDSVYGKVTAPKITFDGLAAQDSTCVEITYTGTTEKVVGGVKVEYRSAAMPTDAGTYTVKVALDNDNYNLTGTTSANFKINKASADSSAPTAKKLTYNGTQQELLTAGSVQGNGNPIQYKREKDTTWSTAIPTAKNAGTDVIMWKVDEDENHKSASGKVNVAIKQAVITVSPIERQSSTYGVPLPTVTYKATGTVGSEVPAFTGKLTVDGEDMGVYDIALGTLKLKDNGSFKAANYKIELVKVKYVINPAYLVLKAADQVIVCGGELDSSKYTITNPVGTDVVTVTLTPSTTGVTYNGTITPSVEVKTAEGKDVSDNYYVEVTLGKLVVEPNFAAIANLTVENVTISQRGAIEQLQDSLNKADTSHATAAHLRSIEEAGATCTVLLAQIEKVEQALGTDAVRKTAEITAENVTMADEAVVEQALADMEKARADFQGNYSAQELKELDEHAAQLKAALETVASARKVADMLAAMPEDVKAEDAVAAEVRAAYGALSEYEKELVKKSNSGKWLDAVAYKILSGNEHTWGHGEDLTFTIDGDAKRFAELTVDGKQVAEKYYSVHAGSTVVTLKTSYLNVMEQKDEHTISFRFDDGEVGGVFYVGKNAGVDGFNFLSLLLWVVVALAAVAGGAFVYLRKKKTAQ